MEKPFFIYKTMIQQNDDGNEFLKENKIININIILSIHLWVANVMVL